MKFSTIIFDLGGVIVDLAIERTVEGFASISGIPVDEVKKIYFSHPVFHEFEKGNIDSAEFRTEIRTIFNGRQVNDDTIDFAWNAMIVGIPPGRLELMQALKKKFEVLILSNTNSIHADYLHNVSIPASSPHNSFEPFAHKIYYSHEVGMRKPDEEIYHHVLEANSLKPAEVLFLDDNADNIAAAKKIGIQSLHILHPDNVTEAFSSL